MFETPINPPEAEANAPAGESPRWRFGENLGLSVLLGLMVLFPVWEILVTLLNRLLALLSLDVRLAGISGSIPLVQHLVLVLGLLGAAAAARDRRLLALTALTTFLKGRWRAGAVLFSQSFAAAVTILLGIGSARWLQVEWGSGQTVALGISTSFMKLLLPVGFGMVAARMIWKCSAKVQERLVVAGATLGFLLLARFLPLDLAVLKWAALAALLAAAALGAPIFTVLGGAGLILFSSFREPISNLAVDHYQMAVHPMLATVPLFTLAGYFLAEGGASRRLIAVFQSLVGHLRGGPAILTVLVCAFFTSFTGASGVTILALGGLLMPVLMAAKFSGRSALGLLTGSGSLGLLFPPCIPLILYAIIASDIQARIDFSPGALPQSPPAAESFEPDGGLESFSLEDLGEMDPDSIDLDSLGGLGTSEPSVAPGEGSAAEPGSEAPAGDSDTGVPAKQVNEVSIESMFLGGIGPGILLVVLASWWGRRQGPRAGPSESGGFDGKAAWKAILDAKWELAVPVVAIGAIFGGFASTVQAAALTAAYAFVVEVFVYRDLEWRRLPKVMSECALLVGGVLLILGVAQGFNNVLIGEQVPQTLLGWLEATVKSPLLFLLMLNLFLLLVGCLMDIYSAIIVIVPMIVPMGLAFGIDPVHLGIIFLANLELGYLTPPVGMNLFLSAYRFDKSLAEVYRAVLPMFGVLAVGVLLITYVPLLTTWLPSWILGGTP